MRLATRVYDINLIHPFGISRGTTTTTRVILAELDGGGIGECSPVKYKKQTIEASLDALAHMADDVTEDNIFDLDYHLARARAASPACTAAVAAFDMALHDRIGKRLGISACQFMGIQPAKGVPSSFTIGIDTDEKMVQKTVEAVNYPNLKIKLGRDDGDTDIRVLTAIRKAAPEKVLRVDANAGWSLDTARRCIKTCADLGIEFVEQPLAIGNLEQLAILKRESPLPLIADEDVQDLKSLPALLGKVDGINIKLMKCGGLHEARQMIAFARAVGWEVMLGCMLETGVAISAACHLASAAVCWDLDSEALIANNPIEPRVLHEDGKLWTPTGPGLGVRVAG